MLLNLTQVMQEWSAAQTLGGAVVLLLIALLAYEYVRWRSRIPGFAGPFGLPILGSLRDIQRGNAPRIYQQWSQKYGPVYQVQLGNIPMLVINTADAARKILTGNSHATMSRPEFYTFHKVVSNDSATTIGTSPYSASLKIRRKTLATALNRRAVSSYSDHIDAETLLFLREALNDGKAGQASLDPGPLFLRMNISLGFTLHWGTRLHKDSDMFHEITEVEEAISNFRSLTSNTQDYVPLIRLLPFNPVSALARTMGARRKKYTAVLNRELDVRIADKTNEPCIRANAKLDPDSNLNAMELESLNATITAAGLDTMQASVLWGIAVLCVRTDLQDKVFRAVRDKYPESNLLDHVPEGQDVEYLDAFIKEVLRCYPATRLSLPRAALEDFVYEDKVVPKDTVIVLNAWACNNDPAIWSDHNEFRPERWLEHPDATTFTFGLGSRMCIGSHLAVRELYVLFLRIVNFFELEAGGPMDIDPLTGVADTAATVSGPKPLQVKFIPRNKKVLEAALNAREL
ncbi:3-hydroxyphenylacetate 6-hydroxylase [Pseudocercospora fuligena]|uniref:3-hydroxyphenylacetate 6-hydroxylase n=1 Tax=Pseudocercospora fuligena TaxID=685502 RepID=A0A8H6RS44_9PEZI|nr:3-hydroxyphenylacetate 6-hydroxylase [Pseudocercospora fuligena]